MDVDGLGEATPINEDIKLLNTGEAFKPNELDSTITDKVSGLVKYEVINRKFNLGKLLRGYGCRIDGQTMYCPFHDDMFTGKPSAKYHPDTDLLYCFSESKMYTAYHALKILYNQDMNKVFNDVWYSMSKAERQEVLDNFSDEDTSGLTEARSSLWDKYMPMLDNFKFGKINYHQLKNGLYKVLFMMYQEESSQEENKNE